MATQVFSGSLLANNDQVRVDTGDCAAVAATVTDTFVGTITFQVLYDTVEGWVSAQCFTRAKVAATATLTAAGNRLIDTTGAVAVRALMTPYTSGSCEVTFAGMPGIVLSAGGGGGGGPVTAANPGDFVDGWDATQGAKADAAATTDTGTFSLIALFKRLLQKITTQLPTALGGTTSANSLPVVLSSDGPFATQTGSITETAPATDTASSGLNGRLQRIAQRLTSLITALGSPFQAGGSIGNTTFGATQSGTWTVQPGNTANTTAWKVDGSAVTQPVSAASLPLPTGAAADATLTTTNTEIGGLTEAAPASDTASSGTNGRLQRIAQRITSLIALLPSALVSNRLDVNLGAAPATVTVQGAGAAGAATSGNPVRVGISDTTNTQDLRQAAASGGTIPNAATGVLAVVPYIYSGAAWSTIGTANNTGDGAAASNMLTTGTWDWNGTTFDRHRNNVITNINTAAITATANSGTQTNYSNSGVVLTLNISAVSGTTPTLDIKVQVADGAGTFFDLTDSAGAAVAFAQKTTTGTDTLKIAPGLVEKLTTTGKQYNGQLPRSYRLAYTVGGTTPSFTARIDALELK